MAVLFIGIESSVLSVIFGIVTGAGLMYLLMKKPATEVPASPDAPAQNVPNPPPPTPARALRELPEPGPRITYRPQKLPIGREQVVRRPAVVPAHLPPPAPIPGRPADLPLYQIEIIIVVPPEEQHICQHRCKISRAGSNDHYQRRTCTECGLIEKTPM